MLVDTEQLITPSEYAKLTAVSPAWVTKQMNLKKVESVKIKGGRLILLPK